MYKIMTVTDILHKDSKARIQIQQSINLYTSLSILGMTYCLSRIVDMIRCLHTAGERNCFMGHSKGANTIVFSPDGKTLFSA